MDRHLADEIKELNRKLSQIEDTGELEIFTVCQQAEKTHIYIAGKMNDSEKKEFIEHLSVCDECRELSAVLSMETSSMEEEENVFRNSWEMVKQGFYKLTETLILCAQRVSVENSGTAQVAYRDSSDINEKDTLTLELPDNYGKVRFGYNKNQNNSSKISVEIVEINEKNILLEVYDQEKHLLISEEGSNIISCTIAQGAGTVIINKKFEIPFKYGDNKW